MKTVVNIIKFIYGWIVWGIVFILSIILSIITWNWEETLTLDMEIVITQICGKSTWNIMTFDEFKD